MVAPGFFLKVTEMFSSVCVYISSKGSVEKFWSLTFPGPTDLTVLHLWRQCFKPSSAGHCIASSILYICIFFIRIFGMGTQIMQEYPSKFFWMLQKNNPKNKNIFTNSVKCLKILWSKCEYISLGKKWWFILILKPFPFVLRPVKCNEHNCKIGKFNRLVITSFRVELN